MRLGGALNTMRMWWPFAALCLAGAAALILPDSLPEAASSLGSLAVASGIVCLGYLLLALLKKQIMRRSSNVGKAAVAGVCLFCGPAAAFFLRRSDVTGSELLLAGCLVPLVVAITVAARGSVGGLRADALWPGVIAPAGLLLLVNEPRMHSIQGALTLVLMPVLTGFGAALLSEQKPEAGSWNEVVAVGAACVVFTIAHLFYGTGAPLPWSSVCLPALIILCTVAALSRIGAVRYSAYFLFSPLLALLFGLVTLRPGVSFRMICGLLLLAITAVSLLRYRDDQTEKPISLLP